MRSDAWWIDLENRKRERQQERPRLHLPTPPTYPREKPADEAPRGVVIIDLGL